MDDVLRLKGPPLPRVRCPTCTGRGIVALTATRIARECPTCRGSGQMVSDERFDNIFDWRAHQLGFAPVFPGARTYG